MKYRPYYTNKKDKQIDYLDEKVLGRYLEILFTGYEIIHNRVVGGSNIQMRPDYRIEELKLIVEFDGHYHYCSSNTQKRDKIKHERYTEIGYKIIYIPYFVQLDIDMLEYYFGWIDTAKKNIKKASELYNGFPQGFISENCVLPTDFNCSGHMRLALELDNFSRTSNMNKKANRVKNEIAFSIVERVDIDDPIYTMNPYLKDQCVWRYGE